MSDILTPEEISSLMGVFKDMGVSQNTEDTVSASKYVSSYNFSRPEVLGKDTLKKLDRINSSFASEISMSIFGNIRIPLTATLISTEQTSYSEYISSLSDEVITLNAHLLPDAPVCVIDISLPLASACIDALTGGDGTGFDTISDFTDIDLAIFHKAIDKIVYSYRSVFNVQSDPAFGLPIYNKSRRELLPTDLVYIATFEMRVGSTPSLMNICLPFSLVKKLLPAKNASASSTQPEVSSSPEIQQLLSDSLQEVSLECKAILGRTTLSTRDIINLQEGDIIRLDDNINSEVEFWVGEKLAYSATPGQSGSNIGLKITRGLLSA